jgi:hypothetical protein
VSYVLRTVLVAGVLTALGLLGWHRQLTNLNKK